MSKQQQQQLPIEVIELLDRRQSAKQRRAQEAEATCERAMQFDFSALPQHPNLIIDKTKENVQMIIDLDFLQSTSAPSIESLLAAVPRYADIISILDVTILIKAPKRHYNVATYKARARNISRLIKIINKYHVRRLEVIAFLNNHNSFGQLTLAAGAYNLRFQGWKLAYKIPGVNRKWKIQIDSQWERQLCALYQAELLTLHQ